MSQDIKQGLLKAIKKSYYNYWTTHARSTQKVKPLHGWVIRELEQRLPNSYRIDGQDEFGGKEKTAKGFYYNKKADVMVSKDNTVLGVISIKFATSNYQQNKNNYFENQLGETANLRSGDIVFGHILVRLEPTPYFNKDKIIKKWEFVNDNEIQLYHKLSSDHSKLHVPDVQCVVVYLLDREASPYSVLRQCNRNDLPNVSDNNFKLLDEKMGIEKFFTNFTRAIKLKESQQ